MNAEGHAIVMYHGTDKSGSRKFNYRFVGSSDLEAQLAYFKEHFHLLTIGEYFRKEFKPGKVNLALTFDDGYANNHTYALPLLKKHGIPATIYVSTIRAVNREMLLPDIVDIFSAMNSGDLHFNGMKFKKNRAGYYANGSGQLLRTLEKEWEPALRRALEQDLLGKITPRQLETYSEQWQLLNEDQLREIASTANVTLGSHGVHHHALTFLTKAQVQEELSHSKKYLEEVTGKEVSSIAYPYGLYTRDTIDMAQSLGYREQLAVSYHYPEDKDDDRLQNRIGLYPTRTNNELFADILQEARNNIL